MAIQAQIPSLNPDTLFTESAAIDYSDTLSTDTIVATQLKTPKKFLTTNKTTPVVFRPEPIIVQHNEWQMITLSLSILLIAFVRLSGRNFFRHLQLGTISRPIFRQLFRDGLLFPSGAGLPLFLANTLVFTTLIYQILYNLIPPGAFIKKPFWIQLSEIVILFVMYSISQIAAGSVLGYIFKTKNIVKEYRTNTLFYNTLITVTLIPILFLSIYSTTNIILWTAISILSILFLLRFFRGLLIAFEVSNYTLYQIFLYLCALEILPILVIIKMLIR